MYNQSALIRIAHKLFPDKNVFNLTKQEQQEVLAIYNEFH
jgi:hypothetical protein